MPAKKKYDLVAKTGEYVQNGETKARWFTCGAVFENENGQMSAKLNGIPVGTDWNGWFTMSVPSDQRTSGSNGASASASASASTSASETKKEAIEEPAEDKQDSDNLPF